MEATYSSNAILEIWATFLQMQLVSRKALSMLTPRFKEIVGYWVARSSFTWLRTTLAWEAILVHELLAMLELDLPAVLLSNADHPRNFSFSGTRKLAAYVLECRYSSI
jgi:hypothetical protein